MEKNKLELTGESYRTTPDSWGESYVMIDEEKATELLADCFDEPVTPDGDPENLPVDVEIGVYNGKFFAIDGDYYREIQNPKTVTDGLCGFISNRWEEFI